MLAGAAAPRDGGARFQLGTASAKDQTTLRVSHGGHTREPVTCHMKGAAPLCGAAALVIDSGDYAAALSDTASEAALAFTL
jgi:hypothetical protein